MFVYLSHSGGRVELPTAVRVDGRTEDEVVRFIDAQGITVAIFRRADATMFTNKDLGTGAQ